MTLSVEEKLITMANQIARQLQPRGAEAAGDVAAHIHDFWTPKMRAQLSKLVAADDARLDPLVRESMKEKS